MRGKKGKDVATLHEDGGVSLRVLSGNGNENRGPRSRMGWKRALVLTLVHVIIVIHVIQWLITGSTVSPVEPSESMQTLELGAVNAGFIFFVLAILSTIVFGRYLCGWGCHVVALQDLCSWMMGKLGVRPKPFRTRLLVLAPLALGLYMFVWPTFKREVAVPLMSWAGVDYPGWAPEVRPLTGFTNELIVEDFWASFPPWYVAIPFLGVCGFAAVYFLGSKGFCNYGCPYGGIFGVADKLSPGRIVVSDACEGCGHCTAVCTSNVRVHEEVRDFGMVVDPGCMKCMDCVSACPKDALRFGFATPPLLAKPKDDDSKERRKKISKSKKRFDLTLGEELVLAVVMLLFFAGFRGMLNQVPMLMAAAMAGIGAFLVWKLWSMVFRKNVRLQNLVLKHKGRLRLSGFAFGALGIVTIASASWSGAVRTDRFRAHVAHESLRVPLDTALRPQYVPTSSTRRAAELGERLYTRSGAWDRDGYGWDLRPNHRRELAFMLVLVGDYESAAAQLALIMEEGDPTIELVRQYGTLLRRSGSSIDDVIAMYAGVLEERPEMDGLRSSIGELVIERDRPTTRPRTREEMVEQQQRVQAMVAEVGELWETRLADEDVPVVSVLEAAGVFLTLQDATRATALLERADALSIEGVSDRLSAARIAIALRDADRARGYLEPLLDLEGMEATEIRSLAQVRATLGDRDGAAESLDRGIELFEDSAGLAVERGQLALVLGDVDLAMSSYERAMTLASDDAWELAGVGEHLVNAGLGSRQVRVRDLGLETLREADRLLGDSATMRHDLAQALFACGRFDDGLETMQSAASLAGENNAIQDALVLMQQRYEAIPEGSRSSG